MNCPDWSHGLAALNPWNTKWHEYGCQYPPLLRDCKDYITIKKEAIFSVPESRYSHCRDLSHLGKVRGCGLPHASFGGTVRSDIQSPGCQMALLPVPVPVAGMAGCAVPTRSSRRRDMASGSTPHKAGAAGEMSSSCRLCFHLLFHPTLPRQISYNVCSLVCLVR